MRPLARLVLLLTVPCALAVAACQDRWSYGGGYDYWYDGGVPSSEAAPPFEPPVLGGVAVQADAPPPPLSGGSLLVVPSSSPVGRIAVASDPDEDRIDVVSIDGAGYLGGVALQPGDEPGRMVADGAGHVHVALRRGGAVVTIDPVTQTLLDRTAVCPAPRGLDYDPASDSVLVACATGELVTLPAAGGAPTRVLHLQRDLRDVVVDGDKLYITRFRSAELLTIDPAGDVVGRTAPLAPDGFQPDLAWRAVRAPGGGVLMLHQRASTMLIDVAAPDAYGAGGGDVTGLVGPEVTIFSAGVPAPPVELVPAGPVIDVAISDDGRALAVPVQGGSVMIVQADRTLDTQVAPPSLSETAVPRAFLSIAVAPPHGTLPRAIVFQQRDPAALVVETRGPDHTEQVQQVALPQKTSHADTGFAVFHQPTLAGVACMSCHAEGGDDGHTWSFFEDGEERDRRTQSLRGGVVAGSAPYHWDGDQKDLAALTHDVLTSRMSGGALSDAQLPILARWLGAVPRIPARTDLDPQRVAAGKAIFEGTGGCVACHDGPKGTMAEDVDIGRETPVQVPMLLGVGDRAPYMHDGCAPTLMARLTDTACAGSLHGNTQSLTDADRRNLVDYLESL